ncbi:cAMP-binding protein [Elizabethkingia anophelis]|nr:cAMP-binding protein [Elizabethkingia anophelis]
MNYRFKNQLYFKNIYLEQLISHKMLKEILAKYNVFTVEELEEIVSVFKYRKILKGEYFIKSGEYSKYLAIIQTGILRSFFTESGEELTYCFRFENQPLASYASYVGEKRSEKTIQALTDVRLWTISKEAEDRIKIQYPNWDRFLKMIIEEEYSILEKQRFEVLSMSPAERYKQILVEFPKYIQHIPLQYIASFIGVSQRHLSRIRSL